VGHQQPRSVAGAGTPPSPLPHAARRSRAPASAAQGSPAALWGSPAALWPLGVCSRWEDGAGAAQVRSPVPGRCSSRGRLVWRPARQPGPGRGNPSPVPVDAGVRWPRRDARLLLLFLCPAAVNRSGPAPASCWLDGAVPRPAGSGGPAQLRRVPPSTSGFIHNLVVDFQCHPRPCPCPRGAGGRSRRHAAARLQPSRVADVVLHD